MSVNEPRHRLPDRLFHWSMALLVFLLVGTGFLPIIGINFDWVPTHWVSGTLLIIAVLFHLWRSVFVHKIGDMIPTLRDFHPDRIIAHEGPGKYSTSQKLYHAAVSTIILLLLLTGGLMLAKIDTTFWRRDPSILTDQQWGIVYVCHGAAASLLLFFLILHIYFAFLPEHRKLLLAMTLGQNEEKPSEENEPKNP